MNDRYLYRAKHIHALSENEHLNGLWIVGYLSGEHHISNKDGEYLIDPSTICQCTGLKDKNGKLIWENDIVTGWFDDKIINGYIMYGSNATFFIERKGLYGIHLDNSEDWLEVIGNIFDKGSENIGKGAEEN